MKIVWSDTALETYLHILDYIFSEWSVKEVEKFQLTVEKLIQQISINNQICPPSKILDLRKCVVTRQTSLVYSIEKDFIFLVTFIDNRALHDF